MNASLARIGFVGLGTMGAAMAAHLARAGHPLTVWNRSPGRAGELVALGAAEAATPSELAARADVVVVCVSDTPDVEAVLFGRDGVAETLAAGSLVIDCSTIAPSGSRSFAARLGERGVAFVDAPVSGGSEGARNATLTIFVGGDEADVERARPILAALGRTITHVGPVGAGQAVKAVNQVILAGAYLGVAEGIVLALKAGLDVDQVVDALDRAVKKRTGVVRVAERRLAEAEGEADLPHGSGVCADPAERREIGDDGVGAPDRVDVGREYRAGQPVRRHALHRLVERIEALQSMAAADILLRRADSDGVREKDLRPCEIDSHGTRRFRRPATSRTRPTPPRPRGLPARASTPPLCRAPRPSRDS